MAWLWLSLVCAFAMAASDACAKRWLADYTGWELVLVRFTFPALLLAPLWWMYPLPAISPALWKTLGALLPLEILAMWLYMLAIRDSPLALTLPYLAFTPVFTVPIGYWLLGETISAHGAAGIGLVVAGTYLLNLDQRGSRGWLSPFRAMIRDRGAVLMLLVALIYALTSVLGKAALAFLSPWQFAPLFYVLLGASLALLYGIPQPARLRVLWRRPGAHFLTGILFVAMVITHFLALERVETAYMIAVKRTSILFGIVFGAAWFDEGNTLRHLLAAGLMVAGVALLAL